MAMNNKEIKIRGLLLITLISFCSTVFSGESELLSEENEEKSIDYGLSETYNSFSEESGWLGKLWGEKFGNRIYAGMWSVHFSPGDEQENTNNLLGGVYNGYYVGTFINTHRDRVYSAGWQRALYRDEWGIFNVEAGYRAGMMYGYTKYLKLGGSKWFPLFQTLLDIGYKDFGVEFSWAGVVATAGFYYRF